MTPNMKSFVEELVLIKVGEAKPLTKAELKQLTKNVGGYALGAGLGIGGGYAVREKLLPKLLPQIGPKGRKALAVGGGALAGLLSTALMKHQLGLMDDASKRNN